MSEEKHDRPRQEASDPDRKPAPGDEVEPGMEGAAETVCDVCGGSGRLDNDEQCSNCNGTGVIIKAVGGGG